MKKLNTEKMMFAFIFANILCAFAFVLFTLIFKSLESFNLI